MKTMKAKIITKEKGIDKETQLWREKVIDNYYTHLKAMERHNKRLYAIRLEIDYALLHPRVSYNDVCEIFWDKQNENKKGK